MIKDVSKENGEVRHMHLSVDDCGDVVFMVTSMRLDEIVRVISFHRAEKKEREVFGQYTSYAKSSLATVTKTLSGWRDKGRNSQ
jgi:hypothetical protein